MKNGLRVEVWFFTPIFLPLCFLTAIVKLKALRRCATMEKKKFYCSPDGWMILIHALTALRNRRIAEGKCIDTVNDTILAVMSAKTKRIKIAG